MFVVPSGLRWWVSGAAAAAMLGAGVMLGAGAMLAQTPSADPPSNATQLYASSCASCHGKSGNGDGPAADDLHPAARDFTGGTYKYRSTASGSIPTDADLIRSITHGMPGTSMPALKGLLNDAQIASLATYIKGFSPRFTADRPVPIKASASIAQSAQSIAKGKAAYDALACGACHGDDGTATGAVASVLQDDWGHEVNSANLTEPWTFRGGSTPGDIYMRLKTGMNGTPMPSFADTAKDEDLWHVANYVASLGRKPAWQMNADELTALYERQRKQATENPVERGKYLAVTLGCAHCHSPVDREGRILSGLKFAGGQKWRLIVWGDVVTTNLTSDNETGIGRYSDEDLKRAITRGVKRDESHMLPLPMAWPAFAHLSADDLNALVAFLRTIPPVSNRIPPPVRLNLVAFLLGKFQMLIQKVDIPLVGFAGNAGTAGPPVAKTAAASGQGGTR